MSIKAISGNTHQQRVANVKNSATAETKTAARRDSGIVAEKNSKFSELALSSSIKKDLLNKKFDNKLETAKTPEKEIPVDVDKKADELIEKHTGSVIFGIGSDLKADGLGKDLTELAKTDPKQAAAVTDNILGKIADGEKDNVARSMIDSMSSGELREFAKTDEGKQTLGKLKDEMLSGWVTGGEKDRGKRIDTAIKAAELENSEAFKKLDEPTRQGILSRLESAEENPKAVDNLIDLVKDANFEKASPNTRNELVKAFDEHKEDKVFIDALKNVAGKSSFQSLSETEQAKVISDVEKFAHTESYKGTNGFIGIGGHNVSEDDKKFLLNTIADTSIYSSNNPSTTSVRNTLDQVLSGDVKMNTYSEAASSDGEITYGYADGKTISLNKHPNAVSDFGEVVDTFVHEVNHIVNGRTKSGTADRFMDEFRAWVVGTEAKGDIVDAERTKEILDNLVQPNGYYDHLGELYENDKEFQTVIDDVYKDLDAGTNVTPGELRQRLIDAGYDTKYLKKEGNLNNH